MSRLEQEVNATVRELLERMSPEADPMRFYARKADKNQQAIVDALRAAGCTVQSLHTIGGGCPDLLVGIREITWLVEVKAPKAQTEFQPGTRGSHAETAERQKTWAGRWRGTPPIVVHSAEEALRALGLTGKDNGKPTGVERFYPQ